MSQTDIEGFLTILDDSPVGISMSRRRDGIVIYTNRRFTELLGVTRESCIGTSAKTHFVDEKQRRWVISQMKTHGRVDGIEAEIKCSDGMPRWINLTIRPAVLDGESVNLAWISNIDRPKATDAKAQRQTELFSTLRQCNRAIAQCTTEEELFRQICHAAVQFGAITMAWIGMIDNESHRVQLAASFGDDTGYLRDMDISMDADSPVGRGPTVLVSRFHECPRNCPLA
jgi:PAS domain S-box-containing protein